MAGEGWEGAVFVFPNPYWGTYTREGDGMGIDADSSSLDPNDEPREGEDRLNLRRYSHEKAFSVGKAEPGGNVMFTPTISMIPIFLMNTCQAVGVDEDAVKGTLNAAGVFGSTASSPTHFKGTMVFAMVRKQFSFATTGTYGKLNYGTAATKWSSTLGGVVGAGSSAVLYGIGSGGKNVGGRPFPLTAIQYFGEEMNDGQFIENAIADQLEISWEQGQNMKFNWQAMGANYLQAGFGIVRSCYWQGERQQHHLEQHGAGVHGVQHLRQVRRRGL